MATKNITTRLVQVSNISPRASAEQIETLFEYLGKIQALKIYPPGPPNEEDDAAPPRVGYIMFEELETVGVSLHLNQTSFIDRPLVVAPMHEEIMPDEESAKSIGTPIQIVPGQPASLMIKQIEKVTLDSSLERPVLAGAPPNLNKPNSSLLNKVVTGPGGTVIQTTDPRLTAMGLPQYPPLPANIDPSKIDEIRRTVYVGNLDSAGGVTAEALLQFFNQIGEVKYVRMAGDETQPTRFAFVEFSDVASVSQALQYNGVNFFNRPLKINHSNNAIVKPQSKSSEAAQREIEEAMKKVKEAASMMTAAIGDESTDSADKQSDKEAKTSKSGSKARGSRSRSRSKDKKRRKSRSRSRERRRRRSNSRPRRSRSRDRKRTRSRERRPSRNRDVHRSRGDRNRNRSRDRDRSRSRERREDRKKSKKASRRSASPGPLVSPKPQKRSSRSNSRSPPPPPPRRRSPSPGKRRNSGSRSPTPGHKKDRKRERGSPAREKDRDKSSKDKDKKKKHSRKSRSPEDLEGERKSSKDIGSKLASLAGLLENVKRDKPEPETPAPPAGPPDADVTTTDMDIDSD